jgi:CubicO group peptidase (beta-lactamase class C family)
MRNPIPLCVLTHCLIFLSVATTCAAEPPDAGVMDAIVRASLKAWEVPGAAVAVVLDNKVIYLKGFGVKELGGKDEVTPDTLFALGSCTKAFTTTLMAMLVDEGKMGWDDPVRKHLDYFHLRDPVADAGLSLRDLVTHRAGLGSNDLLWYHSPLTQDEQLRKLAYLEPSYPFRSGFQYQTLMFTAAGHAVSAASGEKWSDLVQKRIFEPLGMNSANCTTAAALKSNDRAVPHRRTADGTVDVVPWYDFSVPDPAGSINASARDLAQWLRFQLNLGTVKDKRLVSVKYLSETQTPQNVIRMDASTHAVHPETNLMNYGMGWVIEDYRGQKVIAHAGLIDGFRVQLTMVPEKKLGIVVLTNLHEARMNTSVSYSFIDLFLGLPRKDWDSYLLKVTRAEAEAAQKRHKEKVEQRRPDLKPTCELSAYVGTYQDEAYGKMEISVKGGELKWSWNSFSSPLAHFKGDTFTIEIGSAGEFDIEFTVSKKREVTAFKIAESIDREFRKVTAP